MKFLKLLLLSFIFCITTSFLSTDKLQQEQIQQSSWNYETVVFLDWTPSGSDYWSQSKGYSVYNGFDYMITRSKYPVYEDYYYYDFWFYSQSYYWDGYKATYVATNIKNFYVYDSFSNVIVYDTSDMGIIFFDTYNATTLRYISKNPNLGVYFKWGYMSAK